MSYLSLLTGQITRFYSPSSNGVDWESYSTEVYDARYQNYVERYESVSGEAWDSKAIIYTTDEFELEDWILNGVTSETDPRNLNECYRIKLKYITSTPLGDKTIYKYILG